MLTSATTAFVFPGQGSQIVGMGRDLAQAYPSARQIFAEADACLGFSLSTLCWEGPEADLTDTYNTQPALLTCSLAALAALREKLGDFQPAFMAGHSLGEITALVAAGALPFSAGVQLVRQRGAAMKTAGETQPGGMAAVMNAEAAVLNEVCAEASAAAGGVVQIANDNCPGQIVISGHLPALDKALELLKARGIKRAIRLPVSIASHSPLMQAAVTAFQPAVAAAPFTAPRVPVIGNVQAAPLATPAAIRAELAAQLVSPVRWTDSVRYLLAQGLTTFVELGSKDVLTGLLKRIEPTATGLALGAPAALDQLGA